MDSRPIIEKNKESAPKLLLYHFKKMYEFDNNTA